MEKNNHLALVRQHYPNAMTTVDAVNRMFEVLREYYGLEPARIMHADSICSDDVNSLEYPPQAHEMLGPFNMGGLNGFPFTGLTGMGAFAHHVPEDGAVFVYYAPHIGITKAGVTGEINRIGQSRPSACCGAAKAALGKLLSNEIRPGHITDLDYQQNNIEQIFLRQKNRITQAANPLKEATEVMYEAIEERINLLAAKTNYPCQYLILMGGILINGDHDVGSFNSCKRFDVIDLASGKKRDLLESMKDTSVTQ
jgi:Limiting CO2-inducible proteins B/C beta carbonyic anhydrases